eukprot:3799361-Pyramimonas_sp.AAC.1
MCEVDLFGAVRNRQGDALHVLRWDGQRLPAPAASYAERGAHLGHLPDSHRGRRNCGPSA